MPSLRKEVDEEFDLDEETEEEIADEVAADKAAAKSAALATAKVDVAEDEIDEFEKPKIGDDAEEDEHRPLLDFMRAFPGHAEKVAKFHILKFFDGKEMHCGGPIPKALLLSDYYIRLVLNTNVCRGVGQIYDLIEQAGGEDAVFEMMKAAGFVDDPDWAHPARKKDITKETGMFIEIQKMCRRSAIHKYFVSGITIMFLELCLGLKPQHVARIGF